MPTLHLRRDELDFINLLLEENTCTCRGRDGCDSCRLYFDLCRKTGAMTPYARAIENADEYDITQAAHDQFRAITGFCFESSRPGCHDEAPSAGVVFETYMRTFLESVRSAEANA